MDKSQAPCAVILDVDGTVSSVHPTRLAWGDEVVAGQLFGPVLVSPTLCRRLDRLADRPKVCCWWLSSWTAQMRASMEPFPGSRWPVVADEQDYSSRRRGWWKLAAVEDWLDRYPQVRAVAWCDDQLRGGRPAAVRRRFGARDISTLLLTPAVDVGLTPAHLDALEAWTQQW